MSTRRAAFSLVELLVAIALIVAIMGWFALSTRRDQRSASVRAAAEQLASVMRDVRQRALKERVCYGIAFNIRNEPGSSGRVLNNRDGGHWYRVIGPAKRSRYPYGDSLDNLPYGMGQIHMNGHIAGGRFNPGNFADFVDDVERSWVSEPFVLAPRQVRFLAIGDLDEGPRRAQGTTPVFYGSDGHTTYPRPWFGYFDPATRRLHPWGGYDPAIAGSGFCYQGDDGPIPDSRNPTDNLVDHDWDAKDIPAPPNGRVQVANVDRNGDGDTDDPYEHEQGWPIWRQGEPRPLVNAAWLDACLVFQPNGEVQFAEWNRARRAYSAVKPVGNVPSGTFFFGKGGIPGRAKPTGSGGVFTMPYGSFGTAEVTHFDRHTGGFRITLGPDTITDQDVFANEGEALASITPAWVVSVTTFGVVSVSAIQSRKGWLTSLPAAQLWPSHPDVWLATANDNSNPIATSCRVGYLHATTPYWAGAGPQTPIGQPILDVVDPMMLSRRVWWRKP